MRRRISTVVLVAAGLIGLQVPALAADTVGLVDPATGHLRYSVWGGMFGRLLSKELR